MEATANPTGRRWLWLVAFALVANPITLVTACAASFGVADAGNSLIESESLVLYEKWTYRVRDPRAGDLLASEHPEHDVPLVGTVISRQGDELGLDARFMPPTASVTLTDSVTIARGDVDGKVIGSFGGSGDEDLAAFVIFVAPWVAGFVMLVVAVAWAERIRRRGESPSKWWPLPVLLWGIGTLFYAWHMSRADRRGPG